LRERGRVEEGARRRGGGGEEETALLVDKLVRTS
jgi:hypothetical protein